MIVPVLAALLGYGGHGAGAETSAAGDGAVAPAEDTVAVAKPARLRDRSPRFLFELEPLQFISRGFSVVGHVAAGKCIQLGTNVFRSVLGSGLNDLAFDLSRSSDRRATQELGINVSVRYFPKGHHRYEGWVVSLPVGWETWRLEDAKTQTSAPYRFWYVSPRAGYLGTQATIVGSTCCSKRLPSYRSAATAASGLLVETYASDESCLFRG